MGVNTTRTHWILKVCVFSGCVLEVEQRKQLFWIPPRSRLSAPLCPTEFRASVQQFSPTSSSTDEVSLSKAPEPPLLPGRCTAAAHCSGGTHRLPDEAKAEKEFPPKRRT